MSLNVLKKALASSLFLASTSLFAAQLTVSVDGVDSVGMRGSPENSVMTFDIGANSSITGVSYTVNMTAFTPSWLSELGLAFTGSQNTGGVEIRPASYYAVAGTASFSDAVDLVQLGQDFNVGADGILRLEFFESFNDSRISPDGRWNFGDITFEYTPETVNAVPEPATALLLGGGAMLMGVVGRRRRAVAKAPQLA